MPTKVKSFTIHDVIEKAKKKAAVNQKKFNESGGLCIQCEKNQGDLKSLICKDCWEEREKLLNQLRGPGFMEIGIK